MMVALQPGFTPEEEEQEHGQYRHQAQTKRIAPVPVQFRHIPQTLGRIEMYPVNARDKRQGDEDDRNEGEDFMTSFIRWLWTAWWGVMDRR
jgi:hypothetical protein